MQYRLRGFSLVVFCCLWMQCKNNVQQEELYEELKSRVEALEEEKLNSEALQHEIKTLRTRTNTCLSKTQENCSRLAERCNKLNSNMRILGDKIKAMRGGGDGNGGGDGED